MLVARTTPLALKCSESHVTFVFALTPVPRGNPLIVSLFWDSSTANLSMAEVDKQPTGDQASKSKGSRKRKFKSRSQSYKQKQPRPDYQPIVKDNENLVKYYKSQSSLFKNDEEFQDFMQGLRETLPASFRINTFDVGQANFLRQLVEGSEFDEFLNVTTQADDNSNHDTKIEEKDSNKVGQDDESETQEPSDRQVKQAALEPLSWYPNRLAWQMNITRLDLRKSPILQQLHKFLMAETDNGFISRQEAVSMIPPLLLDIKPGQNVLDMCAAPGSKTAQLLEYLKCDIMADVLKPTVPLSDDPFDDGMVVANDVDNKRCYMLVHQSNRLNSPNCIIINQDAARLPDLKTFVNEGDDHSNIKFDRVLCDVPCSGDGTVRKNPDVWKKWSVGNANNFHGMQCKILRRGVELLKKDGLLVYSTCSMNPVEDEAVIASVLRASEGKVVLEEVAHKLKDLKYQPGVSDWIVMNREMEIMTAVDKVPAENATQIYPSLFSPNQEEKKEFKLHKCIRILPHFQNTGGFFVAVLRKLDQRLPWQELDIAEGSKSNEPTDCEKSKNQGALKPNPPNPKKRRYGGFKEDPFVFMDTQDPDWVAIKRVYGLSENFPINQLVHRCTSGKKRSIYLVSKRTRSFIIANREEPGRDNFVKIINGGMRLFSRADTEAGFRICQDGVSEVVPFIKDHIKVPLNRADLIALLKNRTVPFDELSGAESIKSRIKQGSFIFIYKHKSSQVSFDLPLVAWRGEWTVALYVSNTYRVHLCALVKLKLSDDNRAVNQASKATAEQAGNNVDP